MENITTALTNAPSRRLFAPMFRARWQGMQNIVNDFVYINRIPMAYKTYYQVFIQQWLYWSRGFVPRIHRQDFFSTGIGYSVCELLTKMCMSGGFRLKSEDNATQAFIEDWREDELTNIFNQMFFDANAGGNSFLVLTPVYGELYPSVMPINRAVFMIGRSGKISNIKMFNRFLAGETAYYAEEIRTIIDGKAYWKVNLSSAANILSPDWGQNWLNNVPEIIKEQWEYQYGDLVPGEWHRMPERMKGLGVYNVKNKGIAVAIADIPGYSDSTLHTCLDVLYSIDYNYTQGQVDQYMAKTRCLIPKQFSGRAISGTPGTLSEGMSFREAVDRYETQPLEKDFYTEVASESIDGKPIQPTFIQPDLRAEAHRFIRDADIELLAGKIGVSASTLASHLAGGGTKTDDQINAEVSIDEKTVGNKRGLANRAINAMLSDVAYFYGFEGDVTIQWGRSTSNSSVENDQLLRDYQAGTITLREYLKRRWIDMSEDDIEKMATELEKKAAEEQSFDFPIGTEGFNDGGLNEDNERPIEPTSSDIGGRAEQDSPIV